MVIYIFGKSGSGKSYLAKYLAEKLDNSIHIDLDSLNSDLMQMENVINFALNLFGECVLDNNKLDNKKILSEIMQDNVKYLTWQKYMLKNCEEFLKNYITKTSFDYYIIDHMNAGILDLEINNVLRIACVADDITRKKRLIDRDNITDEVLIFRDQKYENAKSDIIYTDNTDKIIEYIQKTKRDYGK